MEEENTYFCYKIIYGTPMQYLTLVLNVCSLLIVLYAISKFLIIRRIGAPMHISITFILIFIWGIFYSGKMFSAFFIYKKYSNLDNESQNYYASLDSQVIFVLDILEVIALQTAITLVPFHWMFQLIHLFVDSSFWSQTENSKIFSNASGEQISLTFQKRCIKLYYVFFILRIPYLGVLAYFIFAQNTDVEVVIAKMYIWRYISFLITLVVETALLFIIMLLGLYSIQNNQNLQELLKKGQIEKMTNQYRILIITTFIKIAITTWFVVVNFQQLNQKNHCKFNDFKDFSAFQIFQSITLFLLEASVTNFLPIMVIIKIYNLHQQKQQISKSLLPQNIPQ